MDKTIRILKRSTWKHRVLHNTCIKHGTKTSEYGVLGRHQPCSEERVEILYQTRSNAIILHETLPAYCIPKIVRMETGRVKYEKILASPRPSPKISLKHDRMKELGSEVVRQPEGEIVQQSKSSQSSQPNPNPDSR